jgi:5-methylcytosine-specific restriction endonuclease McrA
MGVPSSKWHRVTVIDVEAKDGLCSVCGPVRLRKRTKPNGATAWYCRNKHRMYSRGPSTLGLHGKTRAQMSDACERCGFEPEIEQQLEIHHKDQNPGNNIPENLQTLCANCHRFVHFAKAAEVAA